MLASAVLTKIAAAAVAGSLTVGGGVAVAELVGEKTDRADVVETVELPEEAVEGTAEADAEGGSEELDDEATDEPQPRDHEGEGERPTDTHGYEVSETAKGDYDSGRERAAAVTAVARANGEAQRQDAERGEAAGEQTEQQGGEEERDDAEQEAEARRGEGEAKAQAGRDRAPERDDTEE